MRFKMWWVYLDALGEAFEPGLDVGLFQGGVLGDDGLLGEDGEVLAQEPHQLQRVGRARSSAWRDWVMGHLVISMDYRLPFARNAGWECYSLFQGRK